MKVSALKQCTLCEGLYPAKNSQHDPLPNDMGRIVCDHCRHIADLDMLYRRILAKMDAPNHEQFKSLYPLHQSVGKIQRKLGIEPSLLRFEHNET